MDKQNQVKLLPFLLVRVNKDNLQVYAETYKDGHAYPVLARLIQEVITPDEDDVLEYAIVVARDAGMARICQAYANDWKRVPDHIIEQNMLTTKVIH